MLYYRKLGYGLFGNQLKAKIINKALLLKTLPKLGKVEEVISEHEGEEHRSLIEGDYKIIYVIEHDISSTPQLFR